MIHYQAKFVFPMDAGDDQPPQRDAVLAVADQCLTAVNDLAGAAKEGETVRDFGSAAIIPGLINAHTHLEFSDRLEPVGEAGMPFYRWIETVVRSRRESPENSSDRRSAVTAGLDQCRVTGTFGVGEIGQAEWPRKAFLASPLRATVFFELLGLRRDQVDGLVSAANAQLNETAAETAGWTPGREASSLTALGLSPHAPYTVHPELLRSALALSAEHAVPLAMHLAESVEEWELIHSGSGPFAEMLTSLGFWDPTAIPRGCDWDWYLEMLATGHRALVIHGNFLRPADWQFLATQPQLSVVFCPRTHDFFQHGRYPLPEMLDLGVRVAVGTDSRASNPDLCLLSELKFVHRHYGDEVSPAAILGMGTSDAAAALGWTGSWGRLAIGEPLRAVVVSLPPDIDDPYGALFDPRSRVTALLDGEECVELT